MKYLFAIFFIIPIIFGESPKPFVQISWLSASLEELVRETKSVSLRNTLSIIQLAEVNLAKTRDPREVAKFTGIQVDAIYTFVNEAEVFLDRTLELSDCAADAVSDLADAMAQYSAIERTLKNNDPGAENCGQEVIVEIRGILNGENWMVPNSWGCWISPNQEKEIRDRIFVLRQRNSASLARALDLLTQYSDRKGYLVMLIHQCNRWLQEAEDSANKS